MNCFYCKGNMEESTTIHVVEIGKKIIIVKNVPCLKCVQCGETVYTGDTAEKLEAIVKALDKFMTEIAVVEYSDKVA